MVSTTVK